MRTITISEVRGKHSKYNHGTSTYDTRETTIALKATIEPPVNLNPQAVQNYVGDGNWRGYSEQVQPISDVLLVGSTEEATTIYAGVSPRDEQTRAIEVFTTRTTELLGFMGVQAEVVVTPVEQ